MCVLVCKYSLVCVTCAHTLTPPQGTNKLQACVHTCVQVGLQREEEGWVDAENFSVLPADAHAAAKVCACVYVGMCD